ncbi:hypothetical protein [Streptomyces sp. NPDC046925]|uniref:hypothetical protein n=1 Tax=Streptomyces sp. NPDC046925 TaxID=3155375 RepID=UPI0033EB6BF0
MESTVRDAVLDAGRTLGVPEQVTRAFIGLLRPCVHLCSYDRLPQELKKDARPAARVAGLARLPPDVKAPPGLPHVLTIDCAAIPSGILDIDFPADGHLVVHAEIANYPGEGAVVHLPAGTETVEHPANERREKDAAELHEPFPLYAVPGTTQPDRDYFLETPEAVDYAAEDAERMGLAERLIDEIEKFVYAPWTYEVQLGGHSGAWHNPAEDRGDVLFIRIPESAVSHGDIYLTMITGAREQIAERRYDELDFEVEL